MSFRSTMMGDMNQSDNGHGGNSKKLLRHSYDQFLNLQIIASSKKLSGLYYKTITIVSDTTI
jgi:hypothetical protein